jgi:hypothetical protein
MSLVVPEWAGIVRVPRVRVFCKGWDTTAFNLRLLKPDGHLSLRFVVPTLRKKREGWGTRNFVAEPNLDKSDFQMFLRPCYDSAL